ncbi:MAG: tetratricopeptide repeat protein [Legionella sp.]|nr:tetratricopeptide repeat protein [Legionella sp.]
MSVYMTEEEQLEAIKKWWQRYGNIVTVCISIVLLGVAAYRYYNWHHDKLRQQASTTYERMMNEFSNSNIKLVRSYADDLIKNYDHTVYADAAHMTLAKIFITKDKLENARDELEAVASKSSMSSLKQIAKIRIARILANNESYKDALKELSQIDDETFLPVINELKGDIYGAQGQYKEAIGAYRLAMNEVKIKGMGNLFLEMKTNEVVVKTQSKLPFDKVQPA